MQDEVPIWFHHHGVKLAVVRSSKSEVLLESSAASLSITRRKEHWIVRWHIHHSLNEYTDGQVIMSTQRLITAFLNDDAPVAPHSEWLIKRFGGTVAHQGLYIRLNEYLNIPCPGTGHDGDPNISIYIDETIREAIRNLLS
jgi:hypothetical protein